MKWGRRVLATVLSLGLLAYIGAVAYMYVNQRALQYDPQGDITPLARTGLTDTIAFTAAAGQGRITGWYRAPDGGKPLIIYYKGNAGSFSAEHERYETFAANGYGFLAFDYRGFPASPGEISEANILEDALAAYDWAAQKQFPLVIWGRSLGTGPASYVASRRDAQALLLETPFLSAATVAAERYPILPVHWVMLDQFPTNEWIVEVSEPVFVAHGTADQVIGVSNGERVFALAPRGEELWIVPGADHNDLWAAGIWEKADGFFSAHTDL